jgi:hypothetical protein
VYSKSARWFFPGQDVQGTVGQMGGALYHVGVNLAPSGPMRWQGLGPSGSYGLQPKLWVTIMPDQGGFWVNVNVSVEVGVGFIVLFALSWMFCFPVALLILLLSNSSFTQRSDEILYTMQHPVAHLMSTPNWGFPPMR